MVRSCQFQGHSRSSQRFGWESFYRGLVAIHDSCMHILMVNGLMIISGSIMMSHLRSSGCKVYWIDVHLYIYKICPI